MDHNRTMYQPIREDADMAEVIALLKSMWQQQHEMLAHVADSDRRQEDIAAQVKLIVRGFPDSDPVAHCAYHQELIDAARAHTALLTDIRVTVIKRGVIGAIYGIIMLAILGAVFAIQHRDKIIPALWDWFTK